LADDGSLYDSVSVPIDGYGASSMNPLLVPFVLFVLSWTPPTPGPFRLSMATTVAACEKSAKSLGIDQHCR